MSDALPPRRLWSLAAAIGAVAVFGVSIGQGSPLLSLTLDAGGVDATSNGLVAGTAFLGVLLGPLLAPRMVRCVGLRRFLLAALLLDVALFPLLRVFDSLAAWAVLRVLLGIVGSSIFTASEAWIWRSRSRMIEPSGMHGFVNYVANKRRIDVRRTSRTVWCSVRVQPDVRADRPTSDRTLWGDCLPDGRIPGRQLIIVVDSFALETGKNRLSPGNSAFRLSCQGI